MLDLNWNKIDYRGDHAQRDKFRPNNFPKEKNKDYFILSFAGGRLDIAYLDSDGCWSSHSTQDHSKQYFNPPSFTPHFWAEIPKFQEPDEILIRNIE